MKNNWVCLKIVYPYTLYGFADHDPYFLWLFHWGYTPLSLTVKNPKCGLLNETGDSIAHSAWIQQSDGKFATKNWELTIKHSQFNRFFG